MMNMLVLGATGGLGSELVPLLEKKYKVVGLGSNDLDIRDFVSVSNFFNDKSFDIVLNLTAYNYDSFIHKYSNSSVEEISNQLDVNVKGTVNILSNCIGKMREQNYGRIILMSSVLADHPVVSTGVYAGCKGFIDSITKTVAIENANKNVTCNSIQLGYFDAGLTHKIPDEFKETVKNKIPFRRWGNIDELYNTIEYFINTPYITGQNINISGGII